MGKDEIEAQDFFIPESEMQIATDKIHNIYAKDIEVLERVREYCETKILKLQKKIEELPGEKYAEYEHENSLQSDLLIYENILSILNSNSGGESENPKTIELQNKVKELESKIEDLELEAKEDWEQNTNV